MRRSIALLIVFGATWAGHGWATSGGPDWARPLGWDSEHGRAYFLIMHLDELAHGPAVVYVATDSLASDVPVQADFELSTWMMQFGDSAVSMLSETLARQLALAPLEDVSSTSVFHYSTVVSSDTLHTEEDLKYPRYLVRAVDGSLGTFEVETLCEPSVRMLRMFQVPGSEHRFGILSFRAKPYEMCYEVQLPVLIRPGVIRIRWEEWE
jgi:hypothetical protein